MGAGDAGELPPFKVRELWGCYWVFAANGDLKDHAPRLHVATFRPVAVPDSELAFCWLLQEGPRRTLIAAGGLS